MLGLGVASCQDHFWQVNITGAIPQNTEQAFKVTLYKWKGKKYPFLGKGREDLLFVL